VRTALGTVDLGEVTLFPPTIVLQYHFTPDAQLSPYVGAGVNYTAFLDDKLPAGSPLASIDYDESFGGAIQAGVDIKLGQSPWMLNLDVKKVWISTDVRIQAGPALNRAVVTADVDINPLVWGVGIGRKF
jgi:outer membrane protein